MMKTQEITDLAMQKGASHAKIVDLTKMKLYPDLLEMCKMNSCGAYGTTWGCPPGCGNIDDLMAQIRAHESGIVFQYIGQLEDSFDIENMEKSGRIFSNLATALKVDLKEHNCVVLGAGHCHECETCTYPDAPCRFPDRCTVPVEACGVNVSELCALAGLNYINGANTVTYTGLVLLPN